MKKCSASLMIRKTQIKTTVSPYTCQNGCYQKNKRQGVDENMGSWWEWNANWCGYYEKQYGGSSKKLKIELPLIQQSHFWVFIQKSETRTSKRYLHSRVCRSIICNSQDVETTYVCIRWVDRRVGKENTAHVCRGMLVSLQRGKFCNMQKALNTGFLK